MAKIVILLDTYDDYVSGFSTYKQELLAVWDTEPTYKLCYVLENYPTDEVQVQEEGAIIRFYIPSTHAGQYHRLSICCLLKQYLPETSEKIFLINYSPCGSLIEKLKEYFPTDKVVYVIHDFVWATYVLGDVEKFKRIICDNEDDKRAGIIRHAYKDNVITFSLCDHVVCLSRDTFELLVSFYALAPGKISVIPNGLRAINVMAQYSCKKDNNKKIIIAAGRVNRQKGMIDLLVCFKKVLQAYPSCRLVIAGAVSNECRDLIDDSLSSHVKLLGVITHEELYQWYAAADIGIIPSYYEQCSYVGIEMMMFGLPIVASDGFGLRSMFGKDNALIASIDRNNNGELYQTHLADCLLQMLTAPKEVLGRYVECSKRTFWRHYDITVMYRNYLKLFGNL